MDDLVGVAQIKTFGKPESLAKKVFESAASRICARAVTQPTALPDDAKTDWSRTAAQIRVASITLNGECVGMTLASRKPAPERRL